MQIVEPTQGLRVRIKNQWPAVIDTKVFSIALVTLNTEKMNMCVKWKCSVFLHIAIIIVITAIIIIAVNILIFIKLRKMIIDSKLFRFIMLLLFIQILTGIIMYYFDFPFSTQPLHLLISSLIIGFQVYFYVLLNKKKYDIKN